MYYTAKRLCLLVMLSLCIGAHLQAQDTLRLALPEAEKIFVQKNLQLLAQQYNISIAKAQIIQARLYNNPNVQVIGNLYNPQQTKIFDVAGKTGEYIISAQQLIIMAGKRNKQVRLAETNTRLQENRFFDLLRTLRYSLRSDFYQLFFLQSSIISYEIQVGYLRKLNDAYQELQNKGIVTVKDAMRIKALLYALEAEQAALRNQAIELNAEIGLLIQNNAAYIVPVADSFPSAAILSRYTLADLLDSAYLNRFDLQLAQNNLLYYQENYTLQKSLAIPDVTVGSQFDKRGSFVDNASFLTVAMDLPFFNRNQGNIKAAKMSIDQSKTLIDQQKATVLSEVQSAYAKVVNTDKMLGSFDPAFSDQLQHLLMGVTENFKKKNISLLEFTDFYESYKENILQFNQLQNQRMQSIETLQYAIGKTLFN